MSHESPFHITILAGEPSGDALGARLIHALKQQLQNQKIHFSGVGGPQMEVEGLQSLFPMSDLSVMGIAEVLPRLPLLIKRINQSAAHILNTKPDMVITIDSPDFCFRVAKKVQSVRKKGSKMVHYVAPTVWAWREERAQKLAGLYDGVLCLYPFEPPYFEKEGMLAAFTGHPVMESGFETADGARFRRDIGIAANARVLGLLFGSRMGELNRMAHVLRECAIKLATENPDVEILAPTLPHLAREVKNLLQSFPCRTHIITDPSRKFDAFAAMDMALATSGTVGLELAVAGVPHVIGYKMNPLTWFMVKKKIKTPYAHLVNILLEDSVIPERIQKDCTIENLYADIKELADNKETRKKQTSAFDKARTLLYGQNKESSPPSGQAAACVTDIIKAA